MHKAHTKEREDMVFIDKWSLFGGYIVNEVWPLFTGFLYYEVTNAG